MKYTLCIEFAFGIWKYFITKIQKKNYLNSTAHLETKRDDCVSFSLINARIPTFDISVSLKIIKGAFSLILFDSMRIMKLEKWR